MAYNLADYLWKDAEYDRWIQGGCERHEMVRDIRLSQGIETIPHEISLLTNLKLLEITHCSAKSIPDELYELENLEHLDLTMPNLESISPRIANLRLLITLQIKNSQVSELPSEIGTIDRIQVLRLSGNQLNTIPESIMFMPRLIRLDLSKNGLSELPENIQDTEINFINLSGNCLQTIGRMPVFAHVILDRYLENRIAVDEQSCYIDFYDGEPDTKPAM